MNLRFARIVKITLFLVLSSSLFACDKFKNTSNSTTNLLDKYTILFDSKGGLGVEAFYINIGSSTVLPDTYREGYLFLGWSIEDDAASTPFSGLFQPTKDITLYAKWQANKYTISFEENGGDSIPDLTQDYDSTVIEPNITKEGYTFIGWYSDVNLTLPYIFGVMPANNHTLYAKWILNTYELRYIDFDGTILQSEIIDYNADISTMAAPTDPTRVGYEFSGWDQMKPNTMPASNLILQAVYLINNYTITYYLDGGINSNNNPSTFSIVTDSIDFDEPTKEGYTFSGWYHDSDYIGNEISCLVKGSIGNMNLYARWTINQYDLIYYILPDDYDAFNHIVLMTDEIIIQVAQGNSHSSFLTSIGRIFMWGRNDYGQLGDGTNTNQIFPIETSSYFNLQADETIIHVSMGGNHSAALTSTGRVFIWGLGFINTPTDITSLFTLASGETIVQVNLGYNHSSALTSMGHLFMWGQNVYSQLGDGTTTFQSTPLNITDRFGLLSGEMIVSVSMGAFHSSALTSTGRLFLWGRNDWGVLGDSTTIYRSTPTEITSSFNLESGENIIRVSLGTHHSSAITSTNRIFLWGNNSFGQLGDGTIVDRFTPTDISSLLYLSDGEYISQISLGFSHTTVLISTGKIFVWGQNNFGQLGIGTTESVTSPYEITGRFSFEIDESITQLSMAYFNSCILTSSGRIFTWGNNEYGQLGDGTMTNLSSPTEITGLIRIAVLRQTETLDYASSIIETLMIRDGYQFSGWYSDVELTIPFTFTAMPAHNVFLFGKWIPIN